MPKKALFLAPVLLAAALRLPDLAARPMHADEAVHADKLGSLLAGGGYSYDPAEFHGPTLYYLTLVSAWASGARRYVDVTEVTLRAVPAVLGVVLVGAHVALRPFLGTAAAALAALLAALSPAFVFYSRYYIHETLLVLFTLGVLAAGLAYLRRPHPVPALLAGVFLGLMQATKETAPLAVGAMGLALVLTVALDRWRGRPVASPPSALLVRHLVLCLAAAVATAGLLFSSFLTNPQGLLDAVKAYAAYVERAGGAAGHVHPWDFYLRLLAHFPAQGTPVWTEAFILALAAAGAAAGFLGRSPAGADPRVLRFLSFYAVLLAAAYAAIPYKTPWCLLGFHHGFVLLAGAGAVFLVTLGRGLAVRALATVVLGAGLVQLGVQAHAASFRFAADPRNPYVYAHTGTDVFRVAQRLEQLALAHPDGRALPVQVISTANLWPLPFYLRAFPGVAWWTGVSETAKDAPVILVTPDMEPALARKLYERPPPGQRELYVSLFGGPVELRPGVELRGYARSSLWEEAARRENARPPGAPDVP